MTDEQGTIQDAQQGSLEAFSELVTTYQSPLRLWFAVRINSPVEADDLAQETFIIAYRKLKDFDPQKPFKPWIYGIAMNILRNHWRKKKPVLMEPSAMELEKIICAQLPDEGGAEEDMMDALKNCVGQLDGPSAELISERYQKAQPLNIIKEKLGLKHSALTMKLHRIRTALKKCIESRMEAVQ